LQPCGRSRFNEFGAIFDSLPTAFSAAFGAGRPRRIRRNALRHSSSVPKPAAARFSPRATRKKTQEVPMEDA
jgi:hypothetical protein